MIKFFRRIRKNLLSKGEIGKYLKYAIDEIVLAVIGILITIQFNNVYENQKKTEADCRSFIGNLIAFAAKIAIADSAELGCASLRSKSKLTQHDINLS